LRSAHRPDVAAAVVVDAEPPLLPRPTRARPREPPRKHRPRTRVPLEVAVVAVAVDAEVVEAEVDAAAPEACSPVNTPCVSLSTARPTRSRSPLNPIRAECLPIKLPN
jgi:hypothetical protein